MNRASRPSSRAPIRSSIAKPALCAAVAFAVGCHNSRVSGVYVSHGDKYANMLQLTEAENGNVTGVLSTATLEGSGKITSQSVSVAGGAVDGDQVTLTLSPAIFGANVSGTKHENTIRLNKVSQQGQVQSEDFILASVADFTRETDVLRAQGAIIAKANAVASLIPTMQHSVFRAERWVSDADIHTHRISGVEDRYNKITAEMQRLVDTERTTLFSARRAQFAVAVSQGAMAGDRQDDDATRLWDSDILSSGNTIRRELDGEVSSCSEDLSKLPNLSQTLKDSWAQVCSSVRNESARFDLALQEAVSNRNGLLKFQSEAKSKRNSLIAEADRLAK